MPGFPLKLKLDSLKIMTSHTPREKNISCTWTLAEGEYVEWIGSLNEMWPNLLLTMSLFNHNWPLHLKSYIFNHKKTQTYKRKSSLVIFYIVIIYLRCKPLHYQALVASAKVRVRSHLAFRGTVYALLPTINAFKVWWKNKKKFKPARGLKYM